MRPQPLQPQEIKQQLKSLIEEASTIDPNLAIRLKPEMLNVVTKVYIFSYSSPIKGENVNIS